MNQASVSVYHARQTSVSVRRKQKKAYIRQSSLIIHGSFSIPKTWCGRSVLERLTRMVLPRG